MIYDQLATHPYVVMFIGLLLGGETILLPALYLGISGSVSLSAVVAISLLATAISDSLWYLLGRAVKVRKIPSMMSSAVYKKHSKQMNELSRMFEKRGLAILFSSKFVYGTRTATQVLCGIKKIPFWKYFFVNIFGIIALNTLFIVIGTLVEGGFGLLAVSPATPWIAFGVFAFCVVAIHVVIKNLLWQNWSLR